MMLNYCPQSLKIHSANYQHQQVNRNSASLSRTLNTIATLFSYCLSSPFITSQLIGLHIATVHASGDQCLESLTIQFLSLSATSLSSWTVIALLSCFCNSDTVRRCPDFIIIIVVVVIVTYLPRTHTTHVQEVQMAYSRYDKAVYFLTCHFGNIETGTYLLCRATTAERVPGYGGVSLSHRQSMQTR